MSKFIGRIADVGFTKEAVRGTAEAATTYWVPKTALTYDDGVEQAIDESSLGVVEDSPNASVVAKFGEGDIEGNIGDKSFGLLALSALGTVGTAGPTDSAYTHTFSVQQGAQHQSLTLFLEDPNQDYKYPLAVVTSLDLDFALGQFSKFKAGFRSKVGSTATLTPSYTAENYFLPQHGTFGYASTLSGLSSPTSFAIRSAKISISTNAEDDRKLGSLDPSDILNKQLSVEGTLEFVFDDNTFKTEMLADTSKAIRLRFTNTDVTIGAATNPRLTIDLAKVKFGKFTKNYANNDVVIVTVDFKAFYSLSDSKMITLELVNTATAY